MLWADVPFLRVNISSGEREGVSAKVSDIKTAFETKPLSVTPASHRSTGIRNQDLSHRYALPY